MTEEGEQAIRGGGKSLESGTEAEERSLTANNGHGGIQERQQCRECVEGDRKF